mmetsp:Transcript_8682/g.25694  ORF Transcript_8682/g.25694 Transcript_8682/m.25694 type:complete len:531 (+) Transcript_8682:250-1842(+)
MASRESKAWFPWHLNVAKERAKRQGFVPSHGVFAARCSPFLCNVERCGAPHFFQTHLGMAPALFPSHTRLGAFLVGPSQLPKGTRTHLQLRFGHARDEPRFCVIPSGHGGGQPLQAWSDVAGLPALVVFVLVASVFVASVFVPSGRSGGANPCRNVAERPARFPPAVGGEVPPLGFRQRGLCCFRWCCSFGSSSGGRIDPSQRRKHRIASTEGHQPRPQQASLPQCGGLRRRFPRLGQDVGLPQRMQVLHGGRVVSVIVIVIVAAPGKPHHQGVSRPGGDFLDAVHVVGRGGKAHEASGPRDHGDHLRARVCSVGVAVTVTMTVVIAVGGGARRRLRRLCALRFWSRLRNLKDEGSPLESAAVVIVGMTVRACCLGDRIVEIQDGADESIREIVAIRVVVIAEEGSLVPGRQRREFRQEARIQRWPRLRLQLRLRLRLRVTAFSVVLGNALPDHKAGIQKGEQQVPSSGARGQIRDPGNREMVDISVVGLRFVDGDQFVALVSGEDVLEDPNGVPPVFEIGGSCGCSCSC